MTHSPSAPPKRYKRSFKNYLLDRHFQLKYASILAAITLLVSSILCAFLWRTGSELVEASKKAVEQSRTVSEVVRSHMLEDPEYRENKELIAIYNADAARTDATYEDAQRRIEVSQRSLRTVLLAGLSTFVLLVAAFGIVMTHRVAGPVFKIRRLLKEVGDGRLHVSERLRRGDELQYLFETFEEMVDKLRARREGELRELRATIDELRAKGASNDELARLEGVASDISRGLN